MIAAGGWLHVLYLPNVYEVNAKIFVDTRSMLRPLLKGLAARYGNELEVLDLEQLPVEEGTHAVYQVSVA